MFLSCSVRHDWPFNGLLFNSNTAASAAALGFYPDQQQTVTALMSNYSGAEFISMHTNLVQQVWAFVVRLRVRPVWWGGMSFSCSYTKLGYAGNTEPQFIVPSCEYSPVQPELLAAGRTVMQGEWWKQTHLQPLWGVVLFVVVVPDFMALFSLQVSPSRSRPRWETRPSGEWWRGWMTWISTLETKL